MNQKNAIASFWVDPQNGFTENCPDELPVPGATAIVPALLAQSRYANWQILSIDSHPENGLWETNDPTQIGQALSHINAENVDKYWPRHCVKGTFGHQLITGLPEIGDAFYDCIVEKGTTPTSHPYGALYFDLQARQPSNAVDFLEKHAIKQVIVGGLATEFCVQDTVKQLRALDFSVILNLAACRGFPDTAERAIQAMQALDVVLAHDLNELEQLFQ